MTTTPAQRELAPEAVEPGEAPRSAADRFMHRLLRVSEVDRSARVQREAHRNLRISMALSGIRCIITYLLIPIAVPIIGLSGLVAAPVGILLSAVAVWSGIASLRRFWVSDHRMKWVYTIFIAFVFAILAVSLAVDVSRIVNGA